MCEWEGIGVYVNTVRTCNFHFISQGRDFHNQPWLHPFTNLYQLILLYFSRSATSTGKQFLFPITLKAAYSFQNTFISVYCVQICFYRLVSVITCIMCSWVRSFYVETDWCVWKKNVFGTCGISFFHHDCAIVPASLARWMYGWQRCCFLSPCHSVVFRTAHNKCFQSAF